MSTRTCPHCGKLISEPSRTSDPGYGARVAANYRERLKSTLGVDEYRRRLREQVARSRARAKAAR
ncbi:MAG TPA: hypothetical protein VHX44_06685 [Planctomycetota bacterium]|nr:hypothetical protein [Planctomycetota bacterium]